MRNMQALFFSLFCTVSVGQAAVLQSLVVKNDAGKISAIATFPTIPAHREFLLSGPFRAIVDLQQTTTKVNVAQLQMNHDLIERIRSGNPDPYTLRLVFDLKRPSDIKVTQWKTGRNGAQGIRIDLIPRPLAGHPMPQKQSVQAAANEPVPHQYQPPSSTPAPQIARNDVLKKPINKAPLPAQHQPVQHQYAAKEPIPHQYQPPPSAPAPQIARNDVPKKQINKAPPSSATHAQPVTQQPIAIHHAPPRSLRDVLVVIDAGHGGKDPGATGPRRNLEKHVTLNIAMKLKQLIDKQPGMRAVMTRKGDYYVGLRERLNIARKANADMFVSIHADAFNNRNSNGASVYALSQTGATSEAARWLAEKENYSELGGVDLSGLDDKNGLIRTVLLDLSQTATINAGIQVGDKVLYHLNQMTTLHHNKVEQARFMVLKSPDIPSVLVETGFISNPREEFNLTSPAYQARLSNAIFAGVKRYFWDSPPHGTRIEAMLGGSSYLAEASPQAKPRRKTG